MNPQYDQTVRYALRVISNCMCVERDCDSSSIKWENKRLSQKAWDLYSSVSDKEWLKGTVNEHPEPLVEVWRWILQEYASLNAEDILNRIKANPMVTITRDEDAALRAAGHGSKGQPADRYSQITVRTDGPIPRRGKTSPKAAHIG